MGENLCNHEIQCRCFVRTKPKLPWYSAPKHLTSVEALHSSGHLKESRSGIKLRQPSC